MYAMYDNEQLLHLSSLAEAAAAVWPIRQLLRTQTHQAHEHLERVALLTELASGGIALPRYRQYLQRMQSFHAALDTSLVGRLPAVYAVRRLDQSAHLACDLQALDADTMPAPRSLCQAVDALTPDAAAVWGVLYVLEGARLGSQVLLRRNAANPAVRQAHAFIEGEGQRTGSCWRNFCGLLEQGAASHDAQALIIAATHTFVLLGEWLEDPP